jgi:hypothetical protein
MHPESKRRDGSAEQANHRVRELGTTTGPPCGSSLYVAFDEGLAERVRDLVGSTQGLSERKMFRRALFPAGRQRGIVFAG